MLFNDEIKEDFDWEALEQPVQSHIELCRSSFRGFRTHTSSVNEKEGQNPFVSGSTNVESVTSQVKNNWKLFLF